MTAEDRRPQKNRAGVSRLGFFIPGIAARPGRAAKTAIYFEAAEAALAAFLAARLALCFATAVDAASALAVAVCAVAAGAPVPWAEAATADRASREAIRAVFMGGLSGRVWKMDVCLTESGDERFTCAHKKLRTAMMNSGLRAD